MNRLHFEVRSSQARPHAISTLRGIFSCISVVHSVAYFGSCSVVKRGICYQNVCPSYSCHASHRPIDIVRILAAEVNL